MAAFLRMHRDSESSPNCDPLAMPVRTPSLFFPWWFFLSPLRPQAGKKVAPRTFMSAFPRSPAVVFQRGSLPRSRDFFLLSPPTYPAFALSVFLYNDLPLSFTCRNSSQSKLTLRVFPFASCLIIFLIYLIFRCLYIHPPIFKAIHRCDAVVILSRAGESFTMRHAPSPPLRLVGIFLQFDKRRTDSLRSFFFPIVHCRRSPTPPSHVSSSAVLIIPFFPLGVNWLQSKSLILPRHRQMSLFPTTVYQERPIP